MSVSAALKSRAAAWAPRILTQLCRDPSSPLYGCADRNWWHYKIRDFPSIILQQAGYAIHLAAPWFGGSGGADALRDLAAGSARFWNGRALRHHAFEEYYPWEQGYPPLAFSTLAVAKLVHDGAVPLADVAPGLRRAAAQLRTRFEAQAGNQQVAGLAALAWIDRLLPDEADAAAFAAQKARTFALQQEEGWYWEYDGPDLGYLAVTIDCLWDLYDATGDEEFRISTRSALAFIARLFAASPNGIGLHNSRNTDYLVPYGIIRSALEGDAAERKDAAFVATLAFANAHADDHFFAAVDDRYICHYIGQSVMRAVALLGEGRDIAAPASRKVQAELVPGSGHYLAPGLVVSCRKGGILTLHKGASEASDFGWIVERGRRQFVTHWWSSAWAFERIEGGVRVEGDLFPHSEKLSTPPKHMVLRLLSFALGRRLTALLKRVLIFKQGGGGPHLVRTVHHSAGKVEVIDEITGLAPGDRVLRAPRASKRHVASADSYQRQDLALVGKFTEEVEDRGSTKRIVTRYTATSLIR